VKTVLKNVAQWKTKTLLHERSDGEPEAVGECELVVQDDGLGVRGFAARTVRTVPLVRAEACHDEQCHAHDQVRSQHRQPDLERQRRQEGEEAGRLVHWAPEEDADAEVHEGLGEVDHFLAHVADRQRRHCHVRLLTIGYDRIR